MITEWLFGRGSREQAATKEVLGHPSSGIIGWMDRRSHAGVHVDHETAMQTSTVWAATRLLCSSVAVLPFNLYQPRRGGGNQIARDDPVHRLVHSVPNGEMTSFMYRSSRVAKQVNLGNAYSEIERDQLGRPVALHPINTSLVRVERDRDNGDRLQYFVRSDRGRMEVEIDPDDMLHIPSPVSPDGIMGLGVILQAAESIGYTIATERMFSSTMANQATPPIVIKHKKTLGDDARRNFRREWNEIHQGPDRSGNIALLMEGAELQELGFNHQEVQMLQMRQFNVEDLARWYGVPQHMIGHLLRSTFSNIEHQGIEFVKYALIFLLKIWEQECWKKLLTRRQQDQGWYFKFIVDALERGDLQSRTDASMKQFMNGEITLNEWRMREDMDPIGPMGDVHFVPANIVPLERMLAEPVDPVENDLLTDDEDESDDEQDTDDPDDSDEDSDEDDDGGGDAERDADARLTARAGLRPAWSDDLPIDGQPGGQAVASAWMNEVLDRFDYKEQQAAVRAARKPIPPGKASNGFIDWMEDFYGKHEQQLAEALVGPMAAYGRLHDAEKQARLRAIDHCRIRKARLLEVTNCPQTDLPSRVAEAFSFLTPDT